LKEKAMCQTCGCGATQGAETETVTVLENLMARNDRIAEHVRQHFNAHGVLAINLMSSPGSGKTSLLEAVIGELPPEIKVAVIEGDLETENDAARIRRHGIPAIQVTTGVTCHLDAAMVHDALDSLPLDDIDVLFIENVGNLVCPADFDLGQHANVVLLSVTEGDDKPDKYPVIFRAADMVLITKTDLLPHIEEFDLAKVEQSLRRVGGAVPMLALSAKTRVNLKAWCDWLQDRLTTHRLSCPKDGHAPHHIHGPNHGADQVA
jgi:hydrogenase nickel incorporation protein HypB